MEQKTKKILLISIASVVGVFLLAVLGWYIWFMSLFGVYRDKTYGFSIKYPRAWGMQVAPQPGDAVVFVSPKKNALDIFQENVNIAVQDLPEGISTAKGFTDQAVLQMTKVFSNIKVARQSPVSFGNRSGYLVVFVVGKPMPYTIVNVFTVKGAQKAYILTFVAMNDGFKAYLPLVQEMIRSFKL